MRGTPRIGASPLGSQSGVVGVGTVIALGLVGLASYVLIAAFEADTAHYGRVPVPSAGAAIELPEGGTDIYYSEGIEPDSAAPLSTPSDLTYSVVGATGEGLRVDTRGGDPKETDEGMARVLGTAFAPADGTYEVTVDSDQAAQRIVPELAFGQSPFQAIGDRFDSVVEELKGTTGIVVLVALALLMLVPAIGRAARRR